MIREEPNPEEIPEKPPFDVHVMINPNTGEKFYARTEEEPLIFAAMGKVHEKDED